MKLSQAKIVPLLLVLTLPAALSGCGVVNRIRARNALNEGTRAFKDGRFEEAEEKFRYAYSLDPEMTNGPFFIARAAQQQYKPGVDSPENVAKAERAIGEYKKVLETNGIEAKYKEEAYNAVAYIYRQMREEGKEADWLMQRATNNDAPPDKRADAYTILASKKWDCSYAITELPENKETSKDKPGDSHYKIKDPAKYNEAKQCVKDGRDLVEEALKLNNQNTSALAYKVNLMREEAKLAESDGKPDLKAQIDKEADVVEAEQKRLVEEKKSSEEAKQTPAAAG